MKQFTNHTPGPRGILMKDGTTTWIDPGQSVELDPKLVDDGKLPDLGKASKAGSSDDADLAEAFEAENVALTKQVADLTKERDDATKQVADLTKMVGEHAAEIAKLKKPA